MEPLNVNSADECRATDKAMEATGLLAMLDFVSKFDAALSPSMLKVLMYIAQHDGCTVGEVAKGAEVTLSTATRTVQYYSKWYKITAAGRVPGKEFVALGDDERDRRVKRCYITRKGVQFVERVTSFLSR